MFVKKIQKNFEKTLYFLFFVCYYDQLTQKGGIKMDEYELEAYVLAKLTETDNSNDNSYNDDEE